MGMSRLLGIKRGKSEEMTTLTNLGGGTKERTLESGVPRGLMGEKDHVREKEGEARHPVGM